MHTPGKIPPSGFIEKVMEKRFSGKDTSSEKDFEKPADKKEKTGVGKGVYSIWGKSTTMAKGSPPHGGLY